MTLAIRILGEADVRPETFGNSTIAVQAYMRSLLESGNRSLTDPVAFVVDLHDDEHYRLVEQDKAPERERCYSIATCLGGVCLIQDRPAEKVYVEAQAANLKYYNWLNVRSRFASVRIDFDKTGTYKCHRVTWHNELGWCQAEGQSLNEAIDRAMRTVINLETGEYHVPK